MYNFLSRTLLVILACKSVQAFGGSDAVTADGVTEATDAVGNAGPGSAGRTSARYLVLL